MKKKTVLLALIGILALVAVGFTVTQLLADDEYVVDDEAILTQEEEASTESESERQAREAAEAQAAAEAEEKRLEEERLKEEAEAEAKRKAEEERARLIAENTVYVGKKGADLMDTADEAGQIVKTFESRTPLYVEDKVVSDTGETTHLAVKTSIDAVEILGYVSPESVVSKLSDFIAKPIDDVDYEAFERHEAYASNPKQEVRGVYVTGHSASGDRLDELIELIGETELNAMVIDVKDDNGYLLFASETAESYNPKANEKVYIKDMDAFINRLKAENIYLIARIVTFKSPIYARNNKDRAIVYKDSQSLYSDADGLIWASPHDRDLWAYNVGVAKEAALAGFDEIQFDYVRYPAISKKSRMDYRNTEDESHTATIQKFLKYAYTELSPYEVYVAADVFGWTATALDDVGIGQHWEAISNVVDYMCPMMYPSHYGPNIFGLSVPDAYPYETIDGSIKDAIERNSNLQTPGLLRPWIQDFTARWVKGYIPYGTKEVKAQIEALKANGINEYLVWNAGNRYSKNAYID